MLRQYNIPRDEISTYTVVKFQSVTSLGFAIGINQYLHMYQYLHNFIEYQFMLEQFIHLHG